MAFFPLYPLLIRIVGSLAGNHLVAGLLISNASFFFGLLYLYKLLEHEYDRAVARRAIFYVSIFPTAVYFSAVYTESLFFMLTVASFYYMRAHRWWIAGALGFFAALTRVEGVLLVVPFVIEWYAQYRTDPLRAAIYGSRRGRPHPARARGLHGVPLGPARRSALLLARADSLEPASRAAVGERRQRLRQDRSRARARRSLRTNRSRSRSRVLMIAVLVGGWHSLRPSYIAYMALSILVPMSTSNLMSMPRFALVLFPMFAILARWGERPWVNNVILAFSLPLLGLFTVLFADWYWVAYTR